jgi:hypothetical protein
LAAVEEAMAEAAKHGDRSELLAALVAEATAMIEQAKTAMAERARAAAAAKAAAEAAAAAERLRLEEQAAALTLRMQSDALQLQQVHAQRQRRASCRAEPGRGGDAVRGLLRRAQGPSHRAVRSHVRVRGVCGAAEQDNNPDVSRVPRAHPTDREGVLLLAGLSGE